MAEAEVAAPAPEVGAQLLHHGLQADAPGPPRQFPDLRLEPDHGGRRQPSPRAGGRVKENPRNVRSPGRATALFALLTLSLSLVVMKRVMLAITRCPARCAADVDVTVVRLPHEAVAAPLQLPVQRVQHEVRQQGREWAALRRPLRRSDSPTHAPALRPSGTARSSRSTRCR